MLASRRGSRVAEFQSEVLRAHDFNLKQGEVVITFDDGPSTFTEGLAKFLDNKHIPAVYFMNYHNKDKREHLVFLDEKRGQDVVRSLCGLTTQVVANHSDEHAFDVRTPERIEKTTESLLSLCPHNFYFVRFPGGKWNPEEDVAFNETFMPGINVRYGEIFVGPVNWDVTGEDWSKGCQSDIPKCRDTYVGKTVGEKGNSCKGGIVLLHDIYPSTMELVLGKNWRENLSNPDSALGADGMLGRLVQQGCKFVNLADSRRIPQLLGTNGPFKGVATAVSNHSEIKTRDVFSSALSNDEKCLIPKGVRFKFLALNSSGAHLGAKILELPPSLSCSEQFKIGKEVFFYPEFFSLVTAY